MNAWALKHADSSLNNWDLLWNFNEAIDSNKECAPSAAPGSDVFRHFAFAFDEANKEKTIMLAIVIPYYTSFFFETPVIS
jgi:hypothetical protein